MIFSVSDKEENDDIEIISTHDEKIKVVGEIFSNDSSRKILNLLNASNEMTINEIAQNTGLSLALVTHHLKRMQSVQLVKVSRIGKSIKGHEMKYYAATNQSFLIVPSKEPVGSIANSLKKFSKFVAIGLAGLVSWMTLKPDNQSLPMQEQQLSDEINENSDLVVGKWDSASEAVVDSDSEAISTTEQRLEPEPIPEPQLEPEPKLNQVPEPEPSHSGVEHFDFSEANDVANTGAISLDRTVYPQPFDAASDGTVEQLIFAIVISIVVVAGGIILERILTRWYNKRKQNEKFGDSIK